MEIDVKKCTKCFRSDVEFYVRKTGKLQSWCKSCIKARAAEFPSKTGNDPVYRAKYAKEHRDVLKFSQKRFRAKNIIKRRIVEKTWAAKDRDANPEKYLVLQAKSRATKKRLPFDVKVYPIIPKSCPILGIPLFKGKMKHGPNSPSLDQIIAGKGYTDGNIQVISYKANTMKSDASPEELVKFAHWVLKTYATTVSASCNQSNS
jgi:hypothetical protein